MLGHGLERARALAVRPPLAGVLLAIGLLAVAIVWWSLGRGLGVDSAIYRTGAMALLHGEPIYEPLHGEPSWAPALPFTYPPVAAVLFLPLVVLPPQLCWGLLAAASALGLGLVLRVCLPERAATPGWTFGALAGVMALEPVWRSFGLGQVNVLLMAMVVLDVLVLKGSRASGVLVGLAAAIKLTPLIFVLHLLVTGRRADALRATATFAGLNAVTAVLLPADSWRFWTWALLDGNDATTNSWIGNQSLNGLVQRVIGQGHLALAVFGLLAACCLAVAHVLVRRLVAGGDQLGALLVTAFCGLLICPVSWTHHWVWVVPLVCLLLRGPLGVRAWRSWAIAAVAVLCAGWEYSLVPSGDRLELGWTLAQSALGNAYVLAALVMAPAVAVLVMRGGRRTPELGNAG